MGYYSNVDEDFVTEGPDSPGEIHSQVQGGSLDPRTEEEDVEEVSDFEGKEDCACAVEPPPSAEESTSTEAEERQKFEEEEAKRRAEWETKQRAKLQAEESEKQRVAAMNVDELGTASADLLSAQLEAMLKRNLKECIAQTVQVLCYDDPELAKVVMHPRKSLGNCIRYINRRAFEYFEQEMKAAGEVKAPNQAQGQAQGIYCAAIPEELCYKWAEEYYRDPFAKEDTREGEEFIPQTFRPKFKTKGKKKDPPKKKENPEPKPKATPNAADAGQITFDFMAEAV